MDALTREMEDIRSDIEILRALIDRALEDGASGEDATVRAMANVLHKRRTRLQHLERAVG